LVLDKTLYPASHHGQLAKGKLLSPYLE